MAETMQHWLDKRADLTPNDNAIELPSGETLSFASLQQQSRSFAKKLASLGVSKGDHVGICATNSLEMIVALHSISYLGAVVVLLNTRLTPLEINYQLNDAKVSFLLTSGNMYEHGKASVHATNPSIPVVTFSEVDAKSEADISLRKEVNLDDLYTIIYTSGTTGFPKGVQHTYGNHWWSAISSALNLGLDDKDKWLAALPLFHVGGLSILMKSVIYGMPVYLLKKFNVEQIHHGIMRDGVTIVSVVSVMLEQLIDKLDAERYPKTFRCMLLGGGPATKPLLDRAKSHAIPVFQTYGMTETASQIVTLSPKDALTRLGSAGKPLFPAQLKILNSSKQYAMSFEVGEIVVKGPMVTSGYFNRSTSDFLDNDWLATGDLGYVDDDGYLYVIDRRKDLIISGGENVYPAEIESVISELPEVKEVGIIGRKDDKWGQVPVAFIVLNNLGVDERVITDHCSSRLAKFKVPKAIYFVDALPRNASNKLVRHQLEKLLDK